MTELKIPSETSGLVQNLIASFVFWTPNLVSFFFPLSKPVLYFILMYNFVMIFILTSIMSHWRFKG